MIRKFKLRKVKMKEDKNIEQILLNDEEYEKISTKKLRAILFKK